MSTAPFQPPSTSRDAAEWVDAVTLRHQVHSLVSRRGLQGATRTEIEDVFGLQPQTVSARLWELETLSTKPAARKVRAVQPRVLFRIDKDRYPKAVARPSRKSQRPQLVYFAYDAVSVTQVLLHHGVTQP